MRSAAREIGRTIRQPDATRRYCRRGEERHRREGGGGERTALTVSVAGYARQRGSSAGACRLAVAVAMTRPHQFLSTASHHGTGARSFLRFLAITRTVTAQEARLRTGLTMPTPRASSLSQPMIRAYSRSPSRRAIALNCAFGGCRSAKTESIKIHRSTARHRRSSMESDAAGASPIHPSCSWLCSVFLPWHADRAQTAALLPWFVGAMSGRRCRTRTLETGASSYERWR